VITADLLVEDIDFRLEWTTPESLGHKALAVSLSDIASMGGRPDWAILSLGVPARLWRGKFLDRFYEGWMTLARAYGVELVGGDISKTPDRIAIDSIIGGSVGKGQAILRSAAKPGDSIFVTGSIGGAAAGLKLLEEKPGKRSAKSDRNLIDRQLRPTPRVDAGLFLARKKLATSMIDVSDGLAADLHHICEASEVGAVIDASALPIEDANKIFNADEMLRFALSGGEDFELLFTSQRKKISTTNLPRFTRIGEVTANVGVVELVIDRRARKLPPIGFTHF
jgi:thiamine-monophosphate kinase